MFSRANGSGFGFNDKLTAVQANVIDLNQSRAVDGYVGGTYWATGAFVLGGGAAGAAAFLGISGVSASLNNKDQTVAVSVGNAQGTLLGDWITVTGGHLYVVSGAQLVASAGSTTTFAGQVDWNSGSANTVKSGASWHFDAGSTVVANSDIDMSGSQAGVLPSVGTAPDAATSAYFGASPVYDIIRIPTQSGAQTMTLNAPTGSKKRLVYLTTMGSAGSQKLVTVHSAGSTPADVTTLSTLPGTGDRYGATLWFDGSDWVALRFDFLP